jgi:hypothetical protein
MALPEAMLCDANWATVDDDCFFQNEQDASAFVLAEELDFDEAMALPDFNIEDVCTIPTSHQTHSAATPPNKASRRNNPSNVKSDRMDRLRDRNRAAQARFRQKSKARDSNQVCLRARKGSLHPS